MSTLKKNTKNEKLFPNYTENIFWALLKDFKEKYEKLGYNSELY